MTTTDCHDLLTAILIPRMVQVWGEEEAARRRSAERPFVSLDSETQWQFVDVEMAAGSLRRPSSASVTKGNSSSFWKMITTRSCLTCYDRIPTWFEQSMFSSHDIVQRSQWLISYKPFCLTTTRTSTQELGMHGPSPLYFHEMKNIHRYSQTIANQNTNWLDSVLTLAIAGMRTHVTLVLLPWRIFRDGDRGWVCTSAEWGQWMSQSWGHLTGFISPLLKAA